MSTISNGPSKEFLENFTTLKNAHATSYKSLGICIREACYDAANGHSASSTALLTWLQTDKLAYRTYAPAMRAVNSLVRDFAQVKKLDYEGTTHYFLSVSDKEAFKSALPDIKEACKNFHDFCLNFLDNTTKIEKKPFEPISQIERLAKRCENAKQVQYAASLRSILAPFEPVQAIKQLAKRCQSAGADEIAAQLLAIIGK